jgi:hypothetical protein
MRLIFFCDHTPDLFVSVQLRALQFAYEIHMLSSFLLRKLLSLSAVIKISLCQAGGRISSIFESEKIQVVSALSWLKVSVSAA